VQDAALDKVTDTIVVDQSGRQLQVVLFPSKTEKSWAKSINARLLQKGLAGIRADEEDLPEEVNEWYNFEEEARDNQTGIWQYGGADAFDEDQE
jgi:endonuclease YncB( thermonuclease family)